MPRKKLKSKKSNPLMTLKQKFIRDDDMEEVEDNRVASHKIQIRAWLQEGDEDMEVEAYNVGKANKEKKEDGLNLAHYYFLFLHLQAW